MAGAKAGGELQRFYSLTNQLKIQLQALDEAVPSVRVEIQEAPSPGAPTKATSRRSPFW